MIHESISKRLPEDTRQSGNPGGKRVTANTIESITGVKSLGKRHTFNRIHEENHDDEVGKRGDRRPSQ